MPEQHGALRPAPVGIATSARSAPLAHPGPCRSLSGCEFATLVHSRPPVLPALPSLVPLIPALHRCTSGPDSTHTSGRLPQVCNCLACRHGPPLACRCRPSRPFPHFQRSCHLQILENCCDLSSKADPTHLHEEVPPEHLDQR